MIGLDTNILVRVLADEDDPAADRARAARAARGSRRDRVAQPCRALRTRVGAARQKTVHARADRGPARPRAVDARLLRVADADLVEEALRIFRATRADFADCLIGVLNRRAGCATTYTFDRRAAETADFAPVL
jgi:predicted nucleic-acid-binding protein